MSENLNVTHQTSADHELISCADPLESILNDKSDHVESTTLDTCINTIMNASEFHSDNSVLAEINKELETEVIIKQTDEELMDIDIKFRLSQIDKNASGCIETEAGILVSKVVNNTISDTSNAIDVFSQTLDKYNLDQVIEEDTSSKLNL